MPTATVSVMVTVPTGVKPAMLCSVGGACMVPHAERPRKLTAKSPEHRLLSRLKQILAIIVTLGGKALISTGSAPAISQIRQAVLSIGPILSINRLDILPFTTPTTEMGLNVEYYRYQPHGPHIPQSMVFICAADTSSRAIWRCKASFWYS